jgi:hypothetical protein
VISDLRQFLLSCGRLRKPPPDWLDPFRRKRKIKSEAKESAEKKKRYEETLSKADAPVEDTTTPLDRITPGQKVESSPARHKFFTISPLIIDQNVIREACKDLGLSVRELIVEYAKVDLQRAVGLLEFWEAEPERLIGLFCWNIRDQVLRALQQVLQSAGLLPERPPTVRVCPPGQAGAAFDEHCRATRKRSSVQGGDVESKRA